MAIPQICSRMDNCEYHYLNDTTNLLLPSFKFRSSRPEVFLRKSALKICSKFTGEHPCRSAISIKLLCNFIKIALRHGCSRENLLHIFRIPFLKNTSEGLLLKEKAFRSLLMCIHHYFYIFVIFYFFIALIYIV